MRSILSDLIIITPTEGVEVKRFEAGAVHSGIYLVVGIKNGV
jgi:hypothetical protein